MDSLTASSSSRGKVHLFFHSLLCGHWAERTFDHKPGIFLYLYILLCFFTYCNCCAVQTRAGCAALAHRCGERSRTLICVGPVRGRALHQMHQINTQNLCSLPCVNPTFFRPLDIIITTSSQGLGGWRCPQVPV